MSDQSEVLPKDDDPKLCLWEQDKQICQKSFQTTETFQEHMQEEHTLYATDNVCRWQGCIRECKALKDNEQLVQHVRIKHVGRFFTLKEVFSFKCTFKDCPQKFPSMAMLRDHMKRSTHTREEFVCKQPGCDRIFYFRTSMYEHYRMDHPRKRKKNEQKTYAQLVDQLKKSIAEDHQRAIEMGLDTSNTELFEIEGQDDSSNARKADLVSEDPQIENPETAPASIRSPNTSVTNPMSNENRNQSPAPNESQPDNVDDSNFCNQSQNQLGDVYGPMALPNTNEIQQSGMDYPNSSTKNPQDQNQCASYGSSSSGEQQLANEVPQIENTEMAPSSIRSPNARVTNKMSHQERNQSRAPNDALTVYVDNSNFCLQELQSQNQLEDAYGSMAPQIENPPTSIEATNTNEILKNLLNSPTSRVEPVVHLTETLAPHGYQQYFMNDPKSYMQEPYKPNQWEVTYDTRNQDKTNFEGTQLLSEAPQFDGNDCNFHVMTATSMSANQTHTNIQHPIDDELQSWWETIYGSTTPQADNSALAPTSSGASEKDNAQESYGDYNAYIKQFQSHNQFFPSGYSHSYS